MITSKETRFFYGDVEKTTTVNYYDHDNHGFSDNAIVFDSIGLAQEWIEEADNRIYYLSHNECSRPEYTIVESTD